MNQIISRLLYLKVKHSHTNDKFSKSKSNTALVSCSSILQPGAVHALIGAGAEAKGGRVAGGVAGRRRHEALLQHHGVLGGQLRVSRPQKELLLVPLEVLLVELLRGRVHQAPCCQWGPAPLPHQGQGVSGVIGEMPDLGLAS